MQAVSFARVGECAWDTDRVREGNRVEKMRETEN